jgi:hypothetical protein
VIANVGADAAPLAMLLMTSLTGSRKTSAMGLVLQLQFGLAPSLSIATPYGKIAQASIASSGRSLFSLSRPNKRRLKRCGGSSRASHPRRERRADGRMRGKVIKAAGTERVYAGIIPNA